MNMRDMGQRIKTRREKRGLRQSDIADALRISAQAVSKWERGENAPDIALLISLCRLLDVTVEWLLQGDAPDRDTFPATVFCTSLNGFARRAATMAPGDLAAWVNGIYYSVTEALRAHGGVPVKYVGDGSLGFFAGEGHEQRALQAALHAQRMLDTYELVITLHCGEIFLGAIGHPDYARPDVLGATVNTAFLVMPWVAAHCKTRIGITGSVAAGLGRSVARTGETQVLGLTGMVEIFEPVTED
jgi:class 3 adenylate cyclase